MLENQCDRDRLTKLEFTDEELANFDLEDNEAELNLASEDTPVGTFIWQPSNDRFIWDTNIHRLYGVEPGNMPKCFGEWLERIYPLDREVVNQKMELAITQKKFYPFEFRVLLPDGSVVVLFNTGTVVLSLKQTIDKIAIISVNITQTRQTEVALLHSQIKLHQLNQKLEQLVSDRTEILINFTRNLKQLHRLSIRDYAEIDSRYINYLQTGLKIFNLSTGIISKINDRAYEIVAVQSPFNLVPGQKFNCQDTYCHEVIQSSKTVTYNYVGDRENLSARPFYQDFQLESYIATPILVEGKIYGTLSFASTQSRQRDFDDHEREMIELMSHGIGQAIARHQAELEQKQAGQALRESEARFYGAFQSAAIGMAIVSLKGNWLRVNPALCQMLGYSEAELQQTTFQAISHPDDLYTDLIHVDMLLEGHIEHYQMEKRYIHQQGGLVWVNLSVSLVRNESNQPLYFVSLIENISQRKQVENHLRKSEEEFRSLVSNIPGVIYRCQHDSYWTMDFISNGIEDISGYKAEEFIDNQVRSYASIIHPQDREYVEYVIERSLATRQSFILEYRIIYKDGNIRWVYEKGRGIFDDYGNILYLNGAIFDISDRKQVEQALSQSEQRYRALYNNTPVMLHSIDSTGTIISVSDYWLKRLGYKRDEVIGRKYFEFLTEESSLYAREVFLPQFSEISTCIDIPYQFICQNGEIIDVLLSSIAETDNSGTIIASLAVMIDVTERNQAEAAIKQAKQKLHQANLELEQRVEERTAELLKAKEVAETANQAKDHFLAHISHELRTPLNSILGFTQILQKDLNLNEHQRQNIQSIRQSGKHLLTLINDILDFSKITAQKLVLEPKNFCFSIFLDDLVSLVRLWTQENHLSFNYQLLDHLPNAVHGDETRLKQVLLNLLGNAVKFTLEGSVSLRVGYVKDFTNHPVDSSEPIDPNKIRFEVEDTGIGIPEDKLPAIFLPFEQVSNDLSGKQGTGLGLTITDNILQLMDSKIQVRSTLGQGSIFWFDLDLPVVDSDIACASISELSFPLGFRGKKKKILIVDDVPANIQLLSSCLEPLGFEIAEATNGREGLAIAHSFQPDAILVDLIMPVMNGMEMASKVRQEPQFKDIIMLAISANIQFSDCIKFDRELFTAFLSKPIDLNQLLNLLGTYLQLEWIMADTNTTKLTPSSESLVVPSPEILEELFNLAKMGDLEELIAKTVLLKQSDEQYCLFTQQIEQLASNFEQNKLLKLLETFRAKNRP